MIAAPAGYPDQWLKDPWGPTFVVALPFDGTDTVVWEPRVTSRIDDVQVKGGRLVAAGRENRMFDPRELRKYVNVISPGTQWIVRADGGDAAVITYRESAYPDHL